ncbi:MAG TPA: hypothetical protein VE523_05730 [Solirubrobacterales bacterium]|jgi:hypothetical protein|nr:hypothetical protein [Solirubrobacterales bacterium]
MNARRAYSLGAGVAVTVLGVVLLLFEEGTLSIDGGWLAAVLAALAGAALVSSGLGEREP